MLEFTGIILYSSLDRSKKRRLFSPKITFSAKFRKLFQTHSLTPGGWHEANRGRTAVWISAKSGAI